MKLSDSNEDAIVQRICSQLETNSTVITGPGDDCAVVAAANGKVQLLKTDSVIESVHFSMDDHPRRVGWKAIARVISDIAAMGGTPDFILITLMLRKDCKMEWLDGLYQGFNDCARQFRVSIVGGETSSIPSTAKNAISIAGTGTAIADQVVLRSTAQIGDKIFVTGKLGGSITGHHLDFTPRLDEAQFLVNHFKPSAMMDLSDGLAKDLPRLCNLSNVGFQLEEDQIPKNPGCTAHHALTDGEDYELLFTLSPERFEDILSAWPDELAQITCIGEITQSQGGSTLSGGWDHFNTDTA